MTARRTGLLGWLVWGVFLAPAAGAGPGTKLSADIAPRPLPEALAAFGRQTGLQLMYVSSVAETQQSKGARAGLTASEALVQLLDGTGLKFEFLNARTVRIFPAPTVVPVLTASLPSPPQSTDRHASARVLTLEEVVVTGTRGQEPLSRVPIDMAVWTQEAMEASHVKGTAQLGALTPGVAFAFSPGDSTDFYSRLDIRGVISRFGTTVAFYVDDSPIPPGNEVTYRCSLPLTFDLERVEILRGPQTVLLGDHAMSGAVRFTVNQPSLTMSTGLYRAELGTTEYGSPSYEAGAAVGGPLVTDVLGFRVSGWLREDGGYVDRVDPATGATVDANSNRYVSKVARGALTFAPAASVHITPSLTYQSISVHDPSTFDLTQSDPGRGLFRNATLAQQPADDTYYLASVKLTAGLRAADLTALASYFRQTGSAGFAPYTNIAAADYLGLDQRAYFGEVRLTSQDPNAALSWLGGLSASNEHVRYPARWYTIVGDIHFHKTLIVHSDAAVSEQNQIAGFGQVALRVTKRLTASAGVRIGYSKYDAAADSPTVFNARHADTWTAPRLGLSYQADDRNLVYFTVAQGYGSGGVDPGFRGDRGDTPYAYSSETLWNYEIGSKHDLWNGRLRLETSLFHIDWNNDPPDANHVFRVAGRAVSNGIGLTAESLVTEHTKAALSVAYTDAHLTQTLALNGQPFVRRGQSLPVSPWNVTASVERTFPLLGSARASIRLEDVFRSTSGPVYFSSPASATSWIDPSVNVVNVRGTVTWSDFEVAAFISNALGSHPIMSGATNGADNSGTSFGVFTLVPRTINVSSTWRF
jgi:iron complex outermembrane recepter protein